MRRIAALFIFCFALALLEGWAGNRKPPSNQMAVAEIHRRVDAAMADFKPRVSDAIACSRRAQDPPDPSRIAAVEDAYTGWLNSVANELRHPTPSGQNPPLTTFPTTPTPAQSLETQLHSFLKDNCGRETVRSRDTMATIGRQPDTAQRRLFATFRNQSSQIRDEAARHLLDVFSFSVLAAEQTK